MRLLVLIVVLLAVVAWQRPDIYRKAALSSGVSESSVPDGEVLLFTMNGSKGCAAAREFLEERGVEFREMNVQVSEEARQMLADVGGGRGVPALYVEGELVEGFNRDRFVDVLLASQGDAALSPAERRYRNRHFDASGNPRVVVYGTEWCGYCKRARAWLEDSVLDWEFLDVEHDAEARAAYDALGAPGYPLIYFGNRSFVGFNDRIEEALGQ